MLVRMGNVRNTAIAKMIIACVLVLLSASLVKAQGEHSRVKIAILVFDRAQLFDFMGPYDVLRRDNDVYLVAEKESIETYGSTTPPVKIIPQYTFANAPLPDVLVIPGGGSNKRGKSGVGTQLQNPAVIKWVRETAARAKYVLTVCNGAFIAAEAGLLDGKKATTFHTMIDDLRQAYPKVEVVEDQRFVDNGRIISTAGITSGVDGALYLNAKLHGKVASQLSALSLEYAWDPDSRFVRAALADMSIPDVIYPVLEAAGELTDYSGDRNSWTSTWALKKSTFRDVAEALAKALAAQPNIIRPDSRQLKWQVPGRANSRWLLSVEKGTDQQLAIRFQRI